MGIFDGSCSVSGMTLRAGDEVVFMVLAGNSNKFLSGSQANIYDSFASFPFHASYSECGRFNVHEKSKPTWEFFLDWVRTKGPAKERDGGTLEEITEDDFFRELAVGGLQAYSSQTPMGVFCVHKQIWDNIMSKTLSTYYGEVNPEITAKWLLERYEKAVEGLEGMDLQINESFPLHAVSRCMELHTRFNWIRDYMQVSFATNCWGTDYVQKFSIQEYFKNMAIVAQLKEYMTLIKKPITDCLGGGDDPNFEELREHYKMCLEVIDRVEEQYEKDME